MCACALMPLTATNLLSTYMPLVLLQVGSLHHQLELRNTLNAYTYYNYTVWYMEYVGKVIVMIVALSCMDTNTLGGSIIPVCVCVCVYACS